LNSPTGGVSKFSGQSLTELTAQQSTGGTMKHRVFGAIALLASLATVLGACSSNNSSTGGTASNGKTHGAAVKLLVMYQFAGDPVAQHPEVGAGAQAAAQAINAAGGINGHPVQIITCDIHDSATQEQTCAQEAVTDNVTAVAGSLFESGAQSIPTLQKAGIPIIGSLGVYTPEELSNPDVWPLMGGAVTTYPAIPYLVARQGLKRIAVVANPGTGLNQLIQAQASKAGMTYVGTVSVPLTATDYSAYVEQLKSLNPQVIVQVVSTTASAQMMQDGQQLGLNAIWANQTLNIDVNNLSTFGSTANGMYITSSFPPATAGSQFPGIATFNNEMNAAGNAGISNTNIRSAQAITSWLAVHAIADVAKGTTGLLTAPALVSAIKSATAVNVEGLITWHPNATGPTDFPRVTNSDVYLEKVAAGKLELVSPTPVNYFSLAGLTS
jgi:ABC-type branched-subunit amino acid transport system substrate-binding protein